MKRKITLVVTQEALDLIDEVAKRRLGIGRNAFLTLAGIYLAVQFAAIVPKPKRKHSLEKLGEVLTEVRGRIQNAL